MKIKGNISRAIMVAIAMAITCSLNVEAQLLKKAAKGLEKATKGLDKAENILNGDKGNNNSSRGKAIDESSWKKFKNTYTTPYLTPATKYMRINKSEYRFSDVHDGVFAIKKGMNCELWKVTGEKLFDADWRSAQEFGGEFPIFSGGVASAKKATPNAEGKTPICLLYLDGSVRELDPSYESVTPFMDGIAFVCARLNNYKNQYFYIDAAGNKLYPNLIVKKNSNFPIRPLRDGLRAFYGEGEKWGYIDNKGNVKIAPQYDNVTDFANGYAWVAKNSGGVNSKSIIDVSGKIIYTLPDGGYYAKVSDVADGVFCRENNNGYAYYDLTGKKLAEFSSASGFYDGNAFIALGHEHADVIDRNFNIIRRMPYNECNVNDVGYQKPDFKPFGLATVHAGNTVIDPKGNIILVGYDNHNGTYIRGFKQFTECGYMSATNVYINREDCFAYVRPNGEIAWLFSEKYNPGGGGGSPLPPQDPEPPIYGVDPPGDEPPIIDHL